MIAESRVISLRRALSTAGSRVIENSLVLRTMLIVEIVLAWLWLS